jgi:glycerol-3-phosphate dehydrogenase (NAD(P)+)
MSVAVLGAGAFGGALAISLAAKGARVQLWGRNPKAMEHISQTREIPRLPEVRLPTTVDVLPDLASVNANTLLLAVPMQTLSQLLTREDFPSGMHLVACCKGIDLKSGMGPTGLIRQHHPNRIAAILTGPSFATDIARGLPTALTLACSNADAGTKLQSILTTETLRLYTSTDPRGAELGGALKNVIAIACGMVMGAGLGASARAALIARGYSEMRRFAQVLGGEPQTLTGLSGFGDLVLTCTSAQSRNFAFGVALGAGDAPQAGATVEGRATASAALTLAQTHEIDMPIAAMVSAVCDGTINIPQAMRHLMQRDLKAE